MDLTTIVVTKDRPHFLDWWAWNLKKQTRIPDQVVVVDSGAPGRGLNPDEIKERLAPDTRLEYIVMPPSTLVGMSRQEGLEAATGGVITWHDDDDWFHPKKLEVLGGAIEAGYKMAVICVDRRLDLKSMMWFRVRDSITYPHIPYCAFDGELAHSYEFPNKQLGEDDGWIIPMSESLKREQVLRWRRWEVPGIILIHGANTYHEIERFSDDIALESEQLPAADDPPWGISAEEWERTWGELRRVRASLGLPK